MTRKKYQEQIHQLHELEDLPEELREFRDSIKETLFPHWQPEQTCRVPIESESKPKNIRLSCPKLSLDLSEIQDSNILNIVQDKCQRAYSHLNQDDDNNKSPHNTTSNDDDESPLSGGDSRQQHQWVLVEDTCLNFQALKGMPGQVVFIGNEHLVGWKSAIYELEEELGIVGEIKYVVYYDENASPQWRVTGVPTELKLFTTRVPLREEWRGKRDEDLRQVSGIPDANFVHMSGFTGGAASQQGIKAMIHKSLDIE